MEFKDKLKALRQNKGMSQAELAEALGVSHATIGMWESGQRVPRDNMRELIADYFNVDTGYLMGLDRSKFYPDPLTISAQGLIAKNPKLVDIVKYASQLSEKELEIFTNLIRMQVENHEG